MIETDKKVITHINYLAIDFEVIEQVVKTLQNRIVKAKLAGRNRMVKKLQSLLVKSFSARAMAVKRVSENRGKSTAGVDGNLLDTNVKKSRCINELKIKLDDYKSSPLKRVEIPKKSGKTRALGIPTMFDRCIQALYKLALEPIAEIVADKNSYGFRPKRATQDAMKHIWICTSKRNSGEWILEADIKGCFDNISHQWIYDNIPLDNRILKQWLKSGLIKDGTLFPTVSGTPQGGVISPILANMVLDGIEDVVKSHKARFQKMKDGVILYRHTNRLNFIRYADDFIVTGHSPKHLRLLQKDIEAFLNKRGLELSKEKTHITHIRDGFNFLGFNFRKYSNNKVIVIPTKEGIKSFKLKVKELFKKYNSSDLMLLISNLNPLLRGWANYYRFVNSKVVFNKLDRYIWQKSFNWMNRIHQRRQTLKYYDKYFKPFPNYNSAVLSDGKQFIYRLSTLPLKEFIKIKSEANPYDKSFDDYFIKRAFILKNLTIV